jgi:hypothetical protein
MSWKMLKSLVLYNGYILPQIWECWDQRVLRSFICFVLCMNDVILLHVLSSLLVLFPLYPVYSHEYIPCLLCVGTYADVSLLYFIVRICSLNRILHECPVWPVYCGAQSMDLSLYAPLLSYWLLLCFLLACVLYGIGSLICYFYVGVFKHVGDLTHISHEKERRKHRNQHNKTHFTTEPVPSTPLKT